MAQRGGQSKIQFVGMCVLVGVVVLGIAWRGADIGGGYGGNAGYGGGQLVVGATPAGAELHAAIESGAELSEIREIVRANVLTVYFPYKGQESALHWAAAEGRGDLVSIFLEAAIASSSDFKSRIYAFEGLSREEPIHLAIRNGHMSIVELLLEHGVDPDGRTGNGQTPIELARSLDMAEMVELLMRYR